MFKHSKNCPLSQVPSSKKTKVTRSQSASFKTSPLYLEVKAALQTHGIWQSAISYDPYAPTNKDDSKNSSKQTAAIAEPGGENAYAGFQGLLALARITGSNANEARGACKKCVRVGHLTFQCKNFVSLKESKEKDPELQAAVLNGSDKLKGGKVNGKEVESEREEEEEESESSDSDVGSEIERIIAERSGKKVISKGKKSSSKKKNKRGDRSKQRNNRFGGKRPEKQRQGIRIRERGEGNRQGKRGKGEETDPGRRKPGGGKGLRKREEGRKGE